MKIKEKERERERDRGRRSHERINEYEEKKVKGETRKRKER